MSEKIPDLTAARIAFQDIVEYTCLRQHNGDLFFDGHDDFDAALEGLAVLDRLQEIGYDTGIRKTEMVMQGRWRVRGYGWPREVANGKGTEDVEH